MKYYDTVILSVFYGEDIFFSMISDILRILELLCRNRSIKSGEAVKDLQCLNESARRCR